MSWQLLPTEIRLLIFEELVCPDYDRLVINREGLFPVEIWARHIRAAMGTCKEWQLAIENRLIAAITPPDPSAVSCGPSKFTLPTEVIISNFNERLASAALEKSIPVLQTIARQVQEAYNSRGANSTRATSLGVTAAKFTDHYLGDWLKRSVSSGFMSCIKLLLDAGADPDSPDASYYLYEDWASSAELSGRPVEIALEYNHLDIIDLLVNHCNIDLNHIGYGDNCTIGFSLLIHCVRQGHIPLVKSILEKGVPVDFSDPDIIFECDELPETSPLAIALNENNVEMAHILLDHGAGFLNQLRPPMLPLTAAARACSVDTVSMLIERGAEINAVSSNNETALGAAISSKNEPVVRFLLDRGAMVYACHIEEAIKHSVRPPFLQLLLDKSNLFFRSPALDYAAIHGNITLVRYLLDRQTNLKTRLLTAQHVQSGNFEIVKLLLDAGVDPISGHSTSVYRHDSSPLYCAAMIGSVEIIDLLLDHGVPINYQAGLYCTPLQIAAAQGHEQVVRRLLERGASVKVKGGFYGSALDAAISNGYENIQKLLLQYGHPPASTEGK